MINESHLAIAFSRSAAQKQFDLYGCKNASFPFIVGNRSSTRTSTHSPHHHNRNLNTP